MNVLVAKTIAELERDPKTVRWKGGPEALSDEVVRAEFTTVFVKGVFFLEKLSYIVETKLAAGELAGGRLFVGYQSFANLVARRDRYEAIDGTDNRMWAYGHDDPRGWPYPHITPVRYTEDDPLVRTWFIVYDHPATSYTLAAIGHKSSGAGGRKFIRFKGFWSTQAVIAQQLGRYLERVVNPQYLAEPGPRG